MTRFLQAAAVLLMGFCAAAAAQAPGGNYPSRPIKLIVPFTPGASTDVAARLIAQHISGPLGQPVLVENRPGANGGIGMQAVARSAPDGYTFAVSSVSSSVVPHIITKNVPFDLFRDFLPVATMANTPLLLTVAQESPYKTLPELVAAAKKEPGKLTYGRSAGLYRIAMEALNHQAGIDVLGVPFRGPAEAATEMLGGRLSVNPDALGSVMPMLQANRMRALAVLGSTRPIALPDVPTMQELGFKDFEFNGWLGILAPAGTPDEIVQRLHREILKAVEVPEVRATYARLGMEPTVLSPAAYLAEMKKDMARYQAVADKAGIQKE